MIRCDKFLITYQAPKTVFYLRVKFISAIVLLLVVTGKVSSMNHNDENNVDLKNLKKFWILDDQSVSLWHIVIVPQMLDFSAKENMVLARNYSDASEQYYRYSVDGDSLKIGASLHYKLKELTDSMLVLTMKDEEYVYLVDECRSTDLDKRELYPMLKNTRWRLSKSFIEFSDKSQMIPTSDTYSLKICGSTNNKEKSLGAYRLDSYRGNLYLIMIIDKFYKYTYFKVMLFNEQLLVVKEMALDAEEIMLRFDGKL